MIHRRKFSIVRQSYSEANKSLFVIEKITFIIIIIINQLMICNKQNYYLFLSNFFWRVLSARTYSRTLSNHCKYLVFMRKRETKNAL